MKTALRPSRKASADTEAQLAGFIAKFDPDNQKLIRDVRKELRKRFPTANELVYDNYNFFVIGYSGTERPTDSIVSMAAGANGVGLAFPYCGSKLRDPHKLLQGSGAKNRFIRLESAKTLSHPEVEQLIATACALCKPLPASGRGQLIIRSISVKQRPRRKPAK
jgi:hypothetical protein